MEKELVLLTELLGDPIQAREWYKIKHKGNAVPAKVNNSARSKEVLRGECSDRTPFWVHYANQGGASTSSAASRRAWI